MYTLQLYYKSIIMQETLMIDESGAEGKSTQNTASIYHPGLISASWRAHGVHALSGTDNCSNQVLKCS